MKILCLESFYPWMGLCNQLFSLVTAIDRALKEKANVLVLPDFLREIHTSQHCRFSEVVDLTALNRFLGGSMVVIDKVDFNGGVSLQSATYVEKSVQISANLRSLLPIPQILSFGSPRKQFNVITALRSLTQKKGQIITFPPLSVKILDQDQASGLEKELKICWRVGQNVIPISYPGLRLLSEISMSQTSMSCVFDEKAINDYVLTHLSFSEELLWDIPKLPSDLTINVLHLRLEPDATTHWSKINKMSKEKFSALLISKYLALIQQHIQANASLLIVLSYNTSNPVISWLTENGYRVVMLNKKPELGRELNAVRDLNFAEQCSGTFIGCSGSTFSSVLDKRLQPNVRRVFLNLNRLRK